MTRTKLAALAAIPLLLLSGCSTAAPMPTPSLSLDALPTCDTRTAPAVPPSPAARPDVPAGVGWARVALTVFITSPDLGADYCGPVRVRVDNNDVTSKIKAQAIEVDGVTHPLPYEVALTRTPWTGFIVLTYDTKDEQYKDAPPSYSVAVDASYVLNMDPLPSPGRMTLGCSASVGASGLSQYFPISDAGSSVECIGLGSYYQRG